MSLRQFEVKSSSAPIYELAWDTMRRFYQGWLIWVTKVSSKDQDAIAARI